MAKGDAGECAVCGKTTSPYTRNIHLGCADSSNSGSCADCGTFGAAGYPCVGHLCVGKVPQAVIQSSASHTGFSCVLCSSLGTSNICFPCGTVNNSGECPSCQKLGAAGYRCVHCLAAPFVVSYSALLNGPVMMPMFTKAQAMKFWPTGALVPSPHTGPIAVDIPALSPAAPKSGGTACCTACGRDLCAELDAYYGRDPVEAGQCAKCRRKGGRSGANAGKAGVIL